MTSVVTAYNLFVQGPITLLIKFVAALDLIKQANKKPGLNDFLRQTYQNDEGSFVCWKLISSVLLFASLVSGIEFSFDYS